ncbi:MAG: Na-translocating system protein MpsC family protein [Solirubrobacteraceae bacterium]
MSSTTPQLGGQGSLTAAISNAMVGVMHRYTGRGPTRARTTVGDDIIVCVLGSTLTKGEESLVAHGKADVVLQARRAFQDTMEADAVAAVQRLSGRRVIAFMSTNHISPDLGVEIFVLEPLHRESSADVQSPALDGHGPTSDGHGPAADGHGPVSDGRGPVSDGHGPVSDGHGPVSDGHGPVSDGHGPASDGPASPV